MGVKGHVLFDITSKQLFLSRDTIFVEHMLPYHIPNNNTSHTPQHIFPLTNNNFQDDIDYNTPDDNLPTTQQPTPNAHTAQQPANSPITPPQLTTNTPFSPLHSPLINAQHVPHILRKSSKQSKPPSYLQDFHYNMLQGTTTFPLLSLCTNLYPISNFISCSKLSSDHKLFTLKLSSIYEPTSYYAVIMDPNWKGAIDNELQSLISIHTWDLTTPPITNVS